VTLIVDSGPLVALADRRDAAGPAVRRLLEAEPGPIVVPQPIVTEVDHILGVRGGRHARLAFLDDLATGRLLVECVRDDEWATLLRLAERYDSLDPGLADLSIVVLAARFGTPRIATFDRRDFRVLRPESGEPAFELLPAL
jgi:uncharacterized protein